MRLLVVILCALTLFWHGCSRNDDPVASNDEVEEELPRFRDAEKWLRTDDEGSTRLTFGGKLFPYTDIIPEDVTDQRPHQHFPTARGEYRIDYEYAGTTEDGDVWSFRIKPPDGEPVVKAVVYSGELVVVHETPRYRYYLVPGNRRAAESEHSGSLAPPPDWPLPDVD